MSVRFALHSGYVISQSDRQEHHVSAYRLVSLYELRPDEYILWPRRSEGMSWDDYVHLYPRSDGRYRRPRKADE